MRSHTPVLVGAMLAAWASGIASSSYAGNYPVKPNKVVVPLAAGSTADVRARQISEHLSKALGWQVIVENRPGAGNTLGADYVAKSAPDGYTLLYGTIADQSIAPALYPNLPYNPRRDFAPITQNALVPAILFVNAELGVRSMQELIALAKAKPAQLTFGSYGNGTLTHLLLAQLNRETGIEITHVPYKSAAAALTDVVAGRVSLLFDFVITAGPFVKAGKLRPLMIVGAKRSRVFPDVPSAAEVGLPRISHNAWAGFLAPAGTPRDIVNRLNTELVRIVRSPELAQIAVDSGGEAVGNSPEEFAAFIRSEQDELAGLVKATGARVD